MTQSPRNREHRDDDVVVTGLGMVTAGGAGLERHWELLRAGETKARAVDYSLASFQAAPHLSDRKLLKSVSKADAIGLAALEGLRKDAGFTAGTGYEAGRVGLYVGAPPASAFDNEPYVGAMEASRDGSGPCSIERFGETCMDSRPTTLLVGLPNNVLCYGALLLDAKGPNSNYTSTAVSGQMALMNAARRVERGQVDLAVAGAFAAHTEPVNAAMYYRLGIARRVDEAPTPALEPFAAPAEGGEARTLLADGAVFVSLETRAAAAQRGARVLVTYVAGALASDALGPMQADERGSAFENAVCQALRRGGVGLESIGLVLACAAGVKSADACELSVLSRVFAKQRVLPALGASSRVLGNLMEAGGLAELGLVPKLYEAGEVPAAMLPATRGEWATKIDSERPYVLILRTSAWGEHAAVLVRRES
jgi:3-oxoacyl-[acyl-carrier-protein] synthase II